MSGYGIGTPVEEVKGPEVFMIRVGSTTSSTNENEVSRSKSPCEFLTSIRKG